jgi:hypothetical protein
MSLQPCKIILQRCETTSQGSEKVPQGCGALDASVTPVYGAVTYNWQLVAINAPTVILQTIETTAASVSFGGLTPGVIYQVIVNAVGSAGTSDWSNPTNQMVV